MRLPVCLILLGLLVGKEKWEVGEGAHGLQPAPGWPTNLSVKAQGTGKDCPHKKAATLLPSFTVTPTATESTASSTTSHRPTATTSHGNTTVHTSSGPTTVTHNPATSTSHGNATVFPTTNGTATSPGFSTVGPHPGPLPPSPSPRPSSDRALGNYTWTNGSQPCVQLQAQIQIRILYPTQGGRKAWGISVLNPNETKVQGGCDGTHPHLPLSFPYGQLTFGFKQDIHQSPTTVYLNYMAVEYNVSFPQAATVHLDLFSLRLQAAQLPDKGDFGPCFSCASDQSLLLPLIIGLVLLGLLTLVLIAFCITRRRRPTYQPL
ncbi:Macrosialin [Apodemus speciosus]|uniref:Macrosialin n=1 Tax=Apodemus speciosus TaxID=105296 RepID=A0ABQ0FAP3_APOSI